MGYCRVAVAVGKAEQHICERVVTGGRPGCGVSGHRPLELEASTRTVDAGSTGGLEVVKLEMVIAAAVFGGVTAYGPAEVDIGSVLVVSEQERVGTLRVAEWGKASSCI